MAQNVEETQGNPEEPTVENVDTEQFELETGLSRDDEDAIARDLLESMGGDPSNQKAISRVKESATYAEALSEATPKGDGSDEPKQEKVWTHEPTGKTFESAEEYYKFNSGWTADHLGKKNKELLEQLESLKSERTEQKESDEPTQQTTQLDDMEVKKALWPELSDDNLNDPVVDIVYNGLNKVADMMQAQFKSELDKVQQHTESFRKETELEQLRRELGVNEEMEEKVLKNYPQLADMDPLQRIGVVKGLSGDAKAETPKKQAPASTQARPQKRAEDHVEPTSSSSMTELTADPDAGGVTDDQFDKIAGTDAGMTVIKKLIKQNGGFFGMDEM